MKKSQKNLSLTMVESILTSSLMSTPFFSLFWKQAIGLSFGEIGLTQTIFSIAMIVLDYPMGILADKLGRKWCNVIGDFGIALCFLLYATVSNFAQVIIIECALAIFSSLSNGVDGTLIRHFSSQIDQSGKLFKSKFAKLSLLSNVFCIVILLIGAPIGATSYRAVIAATSVPHIIAGIIGLFISDDSEKLPRTESPIAAFVNIAKKCMKDQKMRNAIIVRIFSREATHVMLWITTPIMVMAGLPSELVVLPWIINAILASIGSWFGKKYIHKLANWQFMAIFVALISVSTIALSITINLWTAALFLLMGVAQGLTGATLKRLPEQYADKTEQTSVSSFASTLGRILYASLGCLVNYAADISFGLSAFITFLMFVPICTILIFKLKKEM